MSKIQVLDCTLRDGGFVNDWTFGQDAILNISKKLVASGVEILELGMLNNNREYSADCTLVPHSSYFNDLFKHCNLPDDVIKVGMIILGDCPIENICDCKDSILDGIRVVFKNVDVDRGLEYAKGLKEKGYKVFIQPASITDYTTEELAKMLTRANALNPYAVYIVDTYGLVSKKELFKYFSIFEENLDKEVWIGYHAHNNFNEANANAAELIDFNNSRRLIVDSTLYGMGKNAGNGATELLCNYLNTNHDKDYDVSQFLEAISMNIIPIKKQKNWGYELRHFVSASNKCHPKYVNFLTSKNTLTMKAINEILQRISSPNKTTYVESEIIKLYNEYLDNDIDDSDSIKRLKEDLTNKNILLLCPGKSLETEADKINKFIEDENCTVISLNHANSNFKMDYIFASNSKRYEQVFASLQGRDLKPSVILTSNIQEVSNNYDYMFSFNSILCKNESVSTNAAIIMFNLLIKLGITNVNVAGFDGYSYQEDKNYAGSYLSFKQEIPPHTLNEIIKNEIKNISDKLTLNFVTDSLYNS